MNKLFLSSLLILCTISMVAQQRTQKVNLKSGDIVKSTFEMSSKSKMMGSDMTTDMNTHSLYEVKSVSDEDYDIASTMKKAQMKISSAMFNDEFDSEDEKKQDGMIAGGFKKMLNKEERLKLSVAGKIIDTEDENTKGRKGRGSKGKRGGGMMRMMMGGSGKPGEAVASAFFIIPSDKQEGDKWRETTEAEGLKTITEYTFNGLMGNLANISANQQIKGDVTNIRQGMEMTTSVNRLSVITMLVDINSGLVTLKTIEGKDKSVTQVGDKEMKSDGVSTMTITNELISK